MRRQARWSALAGTACAVLCLLVTCGRRPVPPADGAPVPVRGERVQATAGGSVVLVPGTVRGRQTAELKSRISGNLREVRVKAGERVRAGDVLAVLEASELEAGARSARARHAQSRAGETASRGDVEAARAAVRLATVDRDRVQGLLAKGAATTGEADRVEAAWRSAVAAEETAVARSEAARAGVAAAAGDVASADARAGYALVRAPFAGRVSERRVDPGNLATPGTTLLVIEEEAALRVEAQVPESYAGTVRAGDRAGVRLGSAALELAGTVSEVEPAVDPASRTFRVKVELGTGASERAPFPGMFARVALPGPEVRRLRVGRAAVLSRGGLDLVFVAVDGRARLRVVTLGEAAGEAVEVLSGLDEGETLVAEPPAGLRDGARITVQS